MEAHLLPPTTRLSQGDFRPAETDRSGGDQLQHGIDGDRIKSGEKFRERLAGTIFPRSEFNLIKVYAYG
jgi:hypothetical protein